MAGQTITPQHIETTLENVEAGLLGLADVVSGLSLEEFRLRGQAVGVAHLSKGFFTNPCWKPPLNPECPGECHPLAIPDTGEIVLAKHQLLEYIETLASWLRTARDAVPMLPNVHGEVADRFRSELLECGRGR